MTVYVNDEVLDASLDHIIANMNSVQLLTAYSNVYATVMGDSIGNYVPTINKADNDGAGAGRKGTLQASANVNVDTTANHAGADKTFTHFAIVDTDNGKVLYVGEGTDKLLSDGDQVNTPAAAIRILDAVLTP